MHSNFDSFSEFTLTISGTSWIPGKRLHFANLKPWPVRKFVDFTLSKNGGVFQLCNSLPEWGLPNLFGAAQDQLRVGSILPEEMGKEALFSNLGE